jgi:hypothetical protein
LAISRSGSEIEQMFMTHLVLGVGFILGVTLMTLIEAGYEAEPGLTRAGKGIRAVIAGALSRKERP